MKNKLTFLLDLDGVCVDFLTPALTLIGRPELVGSWKGNNANMSTLTGMSYDAIWKIIDGLEDNFWRNLKEYPWFWEMYEYLKSKGEVVFCTSPSWDENCPKGKLLWLHDRFGRSFRNYAFTNLKHLLATRNSILIDDTEEQCDNFIKAGLDNYGEKGKTILFPQPWNCHSHHTKNRLNFLKEIIDVASK